VIVTVLAAENHELDGLCFGLWLILATIVSPIAARKLIELSGGANTIEKAIEAIVSKLLEAVPFPPTELGVLAKLLGVVDICDESLAGSGELRRLKNGFQIVCSADLDAGRRRFTIAHEIGHVVLPSCGTNRLRSFRTSLLRTVSGYGAAAAGSGGAGSGWLPPVENS
jgi:hypothetical protein